MACVLSVCMGGGVLQPIHITRRVTVLLVPAACCCCYCLHHRTCEWLTCQGGGGGVKCLGCMSKHMSCEVGAACIAYSKD